MESSNSNTGQGGSPLRATPALSESASARASMTREGEIAAAHAVESLSAERVKELRSLGMEVVLGKFMRRLLRACPTVDTLSIYWERAPEFMFKGQVEDVARKLVFGRRYRVTGEFKDLWLLCYPEDDEIRLLVEREIDLMVGAVVALAAQRAKQSQVLS